MIKEANNNVNFADKNEQRSARFAGLKKNGSIRQAATFIFSVLLLLTLLNVANQISAGLNAKSKVLGAATEGITHLKEAENLIKQKNFSESQQEISSARDNFQNAKQVMLGLGQGVNSLLALSDQGKAASGLLDAGEAISNAALNLNNFVGTVAAIKITPQGVQSDNGLYQTLEQARAYFAETNRFLIEADRDLTNVKPETLPSSVRDQFTQYKSLLNNSLGALQQSYDLVTLLQKFLGPGSKTVLVLFENDNELRATGGFIGTYGYFKINNGVIISQKISSIYDLDGQLKKKIAPPGPFHALTDHWGLRDSNWFVNFPDSAKKASDFYELEGSETPDAVIAITPELFVDLLQQTGPIDFPKYNAVLSADNFRRTIQLNTSYYYDKSQNTPKQMLADFAPLLLQKLATVPKDTATKLFSVLLDNLNQKNILVYDRNPEVEKAFASYNWTGQIQDTDRDYLALFNSNLGGQKTDLNVSQSIKMQSDIQSNGSIINTLTYTRMHALSDLDTSFKNIDYARFLVPAGSVLISADGFRPASLYASDGSDYFGEPANSFSVDPELQKVFAGQKQDPQSSVVIGTESGKTEFSGWIDANPGQSTTVTLRYKLPFNADVTKYSLLLQKQPGNSAIQLDYSFNGKKRILWHMPDQLDINGGVVNYKTELNSDTLIGFVLTP